MEIIYTEQAAENVTFYHVCGEYNALGMVDFFLIPPTDITNLYYTFYWREGFEPDNKKEFKHEFLKYLKNSVE